MRKWSAYLFLVIIFAGIMMLFWYNEWVYSLPTAIPKNYVAAHPGEHIDLPAKVAPENNKPVLLHFYNPDCPCSRFNVPHFQSLVKEFGQKVKFAIVVMSDKEYSEKEIQHKLRLDIPVLSDNTLATSCGVYSTPQAVIIDSHNKLYYRGNYNKARYCTDKKTNYAQIALETLLTSKQPGIYPNSMKAYGCELPSCTR